MIMSVPYQYYPRISLLLVSSLLGSAPFFTRGGTLTPFRVDEGLDEGATHGGPPDRGDKYRPAAWGDDDDDDGYDNFRGPDAGELREELLSFFTDFETFAAENVDSNDPSSRDLVVRGARILADLRGNRGNKNRAEDENSKRRPIRRMLKSKLSKKLRECRAGRGRCNRNVIALRKERNAAEKDLDGCVSDRARCFDRVDSLRDAQRISRDGLERCRNRRDRCEEDLAECRDTPAPTSSPSSEPTSSSSSSSSSEPTATTFSSSSYYDVRDCSSYGDVVTVDDAANFCGAVLGEGAAYVLSGDVTCDYDRDGPTLSSGVCLDCNGYSIEGRGNALNFDLVGIRIPPFATGVVVRNCAVENFNDGIYNDGGEVLVSNVRSSNNGSSGVDTRNGGNTRIECSVMNDNASNGIFSAGGDDGTGGGGNVAVDIAGCFIGGNSFSGAAFADGSGGIVSCCEIRSNRDDGIYVSDAAGGVIVRDTIAADSGWDNVVVRGDGPSVTLENVTACGAIDNDVAARDGDFRFESYDGLTCDEDRVDPPHLATCEHPCPDDSSTLALPESCPICPNGVGPYFP